MARPKLGDGESKRLQMVITDEELAAIDEWQHDKRIASRSEAIRRLCEIARTLDSVIPEAAAHASDALTSNRLHYFFVVSTVSKLRRGDPLTEDELGALVGWAADLVDRSEDLLLILMRENNRIVSLMDTRNIQTALAVSGMAEDEINKIINARIENKVPPESQLLEQVVGEMSKDEVNSFNPLSAESQGGLNAYLLLKIGEKRSAFEAYQRDRDIEREGNDE